MILLDTHTVVWLRARPELLSRVAREAVLHTPLSVSAASLYEIAYKGGRGKWAEVENLLSLDMVSDLTHDGIDVLPLSGEIMQQAGALDWVHRDPFDRMIVATALARGIPVVSKDATLDTLGHPDLRRLW